MQICHHRSWHTLRLFLREVLHFYGPIIKLGEARIFVDTGTPSVNGGIKVLIYGSVNETAPCRNSCGSGYPHFR